MPNRRAVRPVARLRSAAVAGSVLGLLLCSAQATAQTPGQDRLAVSFSRELSPHWFRGTAGEATTPVAGEGEIVGLGELNLPGDGPADPVSFRLCAADETVYPLHIDQGTVVREFGKVVFFRFFVRLPARLADQDGLVMQWGDAIEGQNVLEPRIRPDPARRAGYRELVFRPAPAADASPEERQLELKVVVDQHRWRYRLLYLLPIVLVLAAAVIRRLSGSEPTCDA
jgi:hypothetical protein